MDFSDSETSVCKAQRAQRRDRDSLLAGVAFTRKQEKKESKRSRSLSGPAKDRMTDDDEITPQKTSKQSRRRSASHGAEKERAKEDPATKAPDPEEAVDEAEVDTAKETVKEAVKENVDSNATTTKAQRKLSKSALKRQQEIERSEHSRQARAQEKEREKEEEALAAQAEAAAAKRRAAWEMRDAAAREAVVKEELEKKAKAELDENQELEALQAEALAATAAVLPALSASIPRPPVDGPPTYFSKGPVDVRTTPKMSPSADPDLEGWEIL